MNYKIITDHKDHACACDKCKAMCKKTPCLGTPEEMIRISKAGFTEKLAETKWLVGILHGTHQKPVSIIAPLMTDTGCAFQDENGLCILHDLGLKPMEGRLTNNHQVAIYKNEEDSPTYQVIAEWEKRKYDNIERRVFRNYNASN